MNINKIVGFTISKEEVDHSDIDYFNVGLNLEHKIVNDFNIYYWGIGNIKDCIINNKYSLSFPLNENLLDKNILFYFDQDKIIVENDWLGSIPIFYNKEKLIISTLSNKTNFDNKIDYKGLCDFSLYSYSVFENTPFTNTKYLRFYSKLIVCSNQIQIEYKNDPVKSINNKTQTDTNNLIDEIKNYINSVEDTYSSKVLIPTSGGYDSRLLNALAKNKQNCYSYTYGVTNKRTDCYEVVYAKEVCKRLNINWKEIKIDKHCSYHNVCNKIFGFSSFNISNYHIDFFKKIKQDNNSDFILLSGIIGDLWAGNLNKIEINTFTDFRNFTYNHKIEINKKFLLQNENSDEMLQYFKNYKYLFNNDIYQPIYIARQKILFLSFLTILPEYFGIPTFTPYLNFNIAKKGLLLSKQNKTNRVWQKEFFKENNLLVEEYNLNYKRHNRLHYMVYKNKHKFEFDYNILNEIFDENKLKEIISELSSKNIFSKIMFYLTTKRYLKEVLRRIFKIENKFNKNFYNYMGIKTIELSLKNKTKEK